MISLYIFRFPFPETISGRVSGNHFRTPFPDGPTIRSGFQTRVPGTRLRPGQCARLIQDQHQHRRQECLAMDWLGCRSRMSSRMGWLHISSVACSSNRACCHFGSRRGRRRDRFSKPRRLPTPRRALGCGAMAACSVARPCRAGPKQIRFQDFWCACLGDRRVLSEM